MWNPPPALPSTVAILKSKMSIECNRRFRVVLGRFLHLERKVLYGVATVRASDILGVEGAVESFWLWGLSFTIYTVLKYPHLSFLITSSTGSTPWIRLPCDTPLQPHQCNILRYCSPNHRWKVYSFSLVRQRMLSLAAHLSSTCCCSPCTHLQRYSSCCSTAWFGWRYQHLCFSIWKSTHSSTCW